MTSGAMYSAISPKSAYEVSDRKFDFEPSVPTKEFVRKLPVHVIVSTIGVFFKENKTHATIPQIQLHTPLCSDWTIVGIPPSSLDCLAKSKSDNIMWPD
jgi:hypothetical protein